MILLYKFIYCIELNDKSKCLRSISPTRNFPVMVQIFSIKTICPNLKLGHLIESITFQRKQVYKNLEILFLQKLNDEYCMVLL